MEVSGLLSIVLTMARIRTIKPKFWDDIKIGKISRDARLLYIGLWNFADDLGVVIADPVWLKSKIFPYDQIQLKQFEAWLKVLEKTGFISLLTVKSERFYYLPTFSRHQVINKPNMDDVNIRKDLLDRLLCQITDQSRNDPGSIPDQSVQEEERKGRESNTVTSNEDNSICESIETNTSELEINSARTWKNDFEVYKDGLRETYNALRSDSQWIEQQRKYHPGVDILLTLEKACVNYWATEAGWNHKKSQRSAKIDWRRTLTNAISQPQNKVYEPRTAAIAAGTSDRRNSREEMANEAARYLSGLTR